MAMSQDQNEINKIPVLEEATSVEVGVATERPGTAKDAKQKGNAMIVSTLNNLPALI